MRGYLANLSVRSKFVLLISAVVFVMLTAVLAAVWVQSYKEAERISTAHLNASAKAFVTIEKYRLLNRAHIAGMIGTKAGDAVQHGDRQELCALVQRILDYGGKDPTDSVSADYAAVQTPDGQVLAIGLRGHPACDAQLSSLRNLPNVSAANDKLPLMTTWEDPNRNIYSVYAARVTHAESAKVLGTVSVGYVLADGAAEQAEKRTGADVVFWHEEDAGAQGVAPRVLGVSDPNFKKALPANLSQAVQQGAFTIDGEKFSFKPVSLPDLTGVLQLQNPALVQIALVESITDHMRPFKALERYLAVLALCSLLIGIGLGVIFSRPIVRPLVGLADIARDVHKGKYDGIHELRKKHRGVFESLDEIGTLCRAFEDMVVGLTQNREMSKYISHTAFSSLENCGTCHTERKWMVVLFSDIRNFTGFSEGRDPESVVERLNQVLGIQAETVAKHGGDIDKFIGDAMVAWFSGDDRCRRAVNAAREMLAELAIHVGPCAGAQVGVGIHVGEVIVGALGSKDRLDYTAIGSTVNLSERLCSVAQRGQILISQAVETELGDSVPVRALPPIMVKGFAEQIHVYEVVTEIAASAVAAPDSVPNLRVN